MFVVYRTRNKRDEIVAECNTKEEAMSKGYLPKQKKVIHSR